MPRQTLGFDGITGGAQASVVEAKVLDILRSKYLGIGITATSSNPTNHQAGTAIYRVPELVQSQDYSYATRNDDLDTPNLTDIELLLDKKRTVKYELETFDQAVLEVEGAVEAEYAQGISLAILAEIDAEFLKLTMDGAIEAAQYIVNADFGKGRTEETINTQFYDTIDEVGKLEGQVDRKLIGVNKDEVVVITNTTAKARFIKAGNGGDRNEADRQSGLIENINGIAIREHAFVGNTIAAGSSFSKDKDYDFSNLGAVIVHTEAVAMPFALNTVIATTGENSGNPKMVAKFRYGAKIIRPSLVRAILFAEPVEGAKAKVEEAKVEAKADAKVEATK